MSTANQSSVMKKIDLPNLKLFKEGKVRSVFDLDDKLLIVASDRVSAFDVILNEGIPEKGSVLTQVSKFWFEFIQDQCPHHLISCNVEEYPEVCQQYKTELENRSMLVKKTELVEIECIVRGYIVGSGWKEYQKSGTVCDLPLPKGLQLAGELPEPIFTPAFKAQDGDHDENISFERMCELIGQETAELLKAKSLELYKLGRDHAKTKGIILADTKFEFGRLGDEYILIDEVLTPDSSRYWPQEAYQPGSSPPSFDKQIIRDYLEGTDWNKQAPAPTLPDEIIQKAHDQYKALQNKLTA